MEVVGDSDSDAEWEDVEGKLARAWVHFTTNLFLGPRQVLVGGEGGPGGLEIVVPTDHGGHKGKGKG